MIIRSQRKHRFTVIANELLEDEELDWKELGLLVYLLSKPDDWKINIKHLIKERKTGRDGIYAVLKRLCDLGYAARKPNPLGGWDWTIFDEKQENALKDAESGKSEHGKSESGKSESGKSESGFSVSGKSRHILKTERQLNTESLVKTDSSPRATKQTVLLESYGITGDLAHDFAEHRKAKKAAITKTALDGFQREADKAGIDIAEAVRISIERNWQGFNASWDWQPQKSPGAATNNNRGLKQPPEYPDYSVLWEGDNFIDSTAEIITDEPKRL